MEPDHAPDPAVETAGGPATGSAGGVVQLQRSDLVAIVEAAVDRAMGARALAPGGAGRFGGGGGG